MIGIVYKITNKSNGKRYIGQTTHSLEWRWKKHQYPSNCVLLHRAIKKYGKDGFELTIIARCDSMEELNHREEYYIKIFNTLSPNGYNLDTGGKNKKASEETRQKISKAVKGRKRNPHSEESKKKMSLSHTGKRASEETKKKLSVMRMGRKQTPQAIEKLRAFLKGRSKSKEHRLNLAKSREGMKLSEKHKSAIGNGLKKKIVCNETGKIYDSTKDAAIELNVVPSSIWHVLNGKCKTCKGFTFSYVT